MSTLPSLKDQLNDQDMWTRTAALIAILLPTLSSASLAQIHQAALDQKLSEEADRKTFCRYYDVAQVIRKKFVAEGLVRIEHGQVYVWIAGSDKMSRPTAVPHRQSAPAPLPPVVAASPESIEGDVRGAELEGMSKRELQELAQSKDIDTKGMSKPEMIEALKVSA